MTLLDDTELHFPLQQEKEGIEELKKKMESAADKGLVRLKEEEAEEDKFP